MTVALRSKCKNVLHFTGVIESEFRSDVNRPAAPEETRENLLDLTPDQAEARLRAWFEGIGQPGYRAKQVVRHLWVAPVAGFDEMTDVPKGLREKLAARFEIPRLPIVARQASRDGTEKFLFRLHDGEAIENGHPQTVRNGTTGSVTTGTPIQSESQEVVPPLAGKGSSVRSMVHGPISPLAPASVPSDRSLKKRCRISPGTRASRYMLVKMPKK